MLDTGPFEFVTRIKQYSHAQIKKVFSEWLEKIIDLMSKFGKTMDIKHNYGSKIYPKIQVIFYCFMPST